MHCADVAEQWIGTSMHVATWCVILMHTVIKWIKAVSSNRRHLVECTGMPMNLDAASSNSMTAIK